MATTDESFISPHIKAAEPAKLEGGLRTKGGQKKSSENMPLITVITVVLNGERYLEETMMSVFSQSYDNIEYIVIDGSSEDRTLDIIRKYDEKIDYWISERDSGIYEAMNKGIQLSQGLLINILNADDYLDPDIIAKIVLQYRENPQSGIVFGHYRLIDEILGYQIDVRSNLKCWLGMTVSHQAMFVERDIYTAVGRYDTRFRLAADYDFLLRCFLNKVSLRDVDMTVVNRRLHGLGGKNFFRSKYETNCINKKYFGGQIFRRMAFFKTAFFDAVKILTIRGMHCLLGRTKTRNLLMLYYRTRSVNSQLM